MRGSTETASDYGEGFQPEHVLGARVVDVGLFVLNEKEIVYSAADYVVIQDVGTGGQRFIESGVPTAMVVNHSRNLIGVAARGTGAIKFYDPATLRCRRRLRHESISDVRHISLSRDSTKCLVLGGPPGYLLTMWDMDRSAAYASIRLSTVTKNDIVGADLSPANNTLVSIIGRKVIRLFHVSNKIGKFMPAKTNLKMEPHSHSVQCWLPASGNLVIGTNNGTLVVMEDDIKTKQLLKVEHAITSITACPRGFVVGCCQGSVALFQRSKKSDSYSLTRTVHLKDEVAIGALAVMKIQRSPKCDAICLTQSHSIIRIPLTSSDDDCNEKEIVPPLNLSSQSIRDLIPDYGALFVDCCEWKPLIAIGGYDGYIRLFNYRTHQVLLSHQLEDRIYNISLHPSGAYLLASLPKAARLFSVLVDRLVVSWQVENLPQPALVRFSQAGDRFAIAFGTTVQVHDLYTSFQSVSTLIGHSKSILEVSFRGNKDELITVGADGVVCLWDINRGTTLSRVVDLKSSGYITGCATKDLTHVYVMTADCLLKKINVEKGEYDAEFKCDPGIKVMAALSLGKIIGYSDDGHVVCAYIKGDSLARQDCFNQNNVTSICCRSGGRKCISADREGFVTVHSYDSIALQMSEYCPYDGVSMTPRAEFEEKIGNINLMKGSVQASQSEHSVKLESSNLSYETLKANVTDELQLKVDRLLHEVDELVDDVQSLEADGKLEMDRLEKMHQLTLTSAREDCAKRLDAEKVNTKHFLKSNEDKKRSFDNQMAELTNNHVIKIDRETRTLHDLILDENRKNEELVNAINTTRLHSSDLEKNMEDDAEREITEITFTHKQDMNSLSRSNTLLSNEKDVLRQRHGTMLVDLKELQEQINSQEDKMRVCEDAKAVLLTATKANQVAITDQEMKILDRERDMCFFSQANLEEEHRQSDLAEDRIRMEESLAIEEKEVKTKEDEVKEKKLDLRDVECNTKKTHIEMEGLTMKLRQLRTSANGMQRKIEEKKQLLCTLEKGIAQATNFIDDHKSLKASLCSFSDSFLHGTSKRKSSSTASNAEKVLVIDKKINTMRQTIERKKKNNGVEMQRLLREHGILMKELQDIRKEAKGNSVKAKYKLQQARANTPLSNSKLVNGQEA